MNYQIKSNLPVSGSHWGLLFRDGVAVTEKRGLADKLKERGYEVSEILEAGTVDNIVKIVDDAIIEPEQEIFTCPKCSKQYKSASALKRHFDKCEAE